MGVGRASSSAFTSGGLDEKRLLIDKILTTRRLLLDDERTRTRTGTAVNNKLRNNKDMDTNTNENTNNTRDVMNNNPVQRNHFHRRSSSAASLKSLDSSIDLCPIFICLVELSK